MGTGAFWRGVQLRQTLVLLLSCWELPPLSFLSPGSDREPWELFALWALTKGGRAVQAAD